MCFALQSVALFGQSLLIQSPRATENLVSLQCTQLWTQIAVCSLWLQIINCYAIEIHLERIFHCSGQLLNISLTFLVKDLEYLLIVFMFRSYEIRYAMQSVAIEIIRVLQASTVLLFLFKTLNHNSVDLRKSCNTVVPQKYKHFSEV